MIFPLLKGDDAWATRAMLGEELWIDERPRDAAMVVNAAATVAGICAGVAARRRVAVPTAVPVAVEMGLLLVYWQQMVSYYDRLRVRPARVRLTGAASIHRRSVVPISLILGTRAWTAPCSKRCGRAAAATFHRGWHPLPSSGATP